MNFTSRLSILTLLFLLGAAASGLAQSRTWGFSKDTVYEWAAGGDSVFISNVGTDSLRFDSIGLEMIRPTSTILDIDLQIKAKQDLYFFMRKNEGVISYGGNHPNQVVVPPGQNGVVNQFRTEDRIAMVAKHAVINRGDTLFIRMIFMASQSRGRDTLILKGKQDFASSLRTGRVHLKPSVSVDHLFDLRGRRVEELPKGVKAPFAPLVSPKD